MSSAQADKADKVPLLQDQAVVEAIQKRLADIGDSVYELLPADVKRRVKALKNLQVARLEIEQGFHDEVHKLECKYASLYVDNHAKRSKIVGGAYEPNDAECDYPSDEEEESEDLDASNSDGTKLARELKQKAAIEDAQAGKGDKEPAKGIPSFWLTVFRNVDVMQANIQDQDEAVLEYLTDLRAVYHESPPGFTLEFEFAENPYFANRVLTKLYSLRITPDPEDKINYEGPEIVSTKGCEIEWKAGKNVTVKTVTKKQRHKSKGQVRTVQQTVQADSFFNFFAPPELNEDDEEEDNDTQEILQADFEMGELMRSALIPRAVLYFTGEAVDYSDDEDDDDDEEDSDYEEEDDDDEEEASPSAGKKSGSKHGKKGGAKNGLGPDGKEQPAECKQQ